jgi:hypothetical protein
MLEGTDIKTLTVVLEAISNVLKRGTIVTIIPGDLAGSDNPFLSEFEALNGIKKLE